MAYNFHSKNLPTPVFSSSDSLDSLEEISMSSVIYLVTLFSLKMYLHSSKTLKDNSF